MFYINEDRYAKVWEVSVADSRSYATLKISTTRKSKDTDEKYYSNWTAKVFGSNVTKAESIKPNSSIKIKRCSIQNELYTAKDGTKKSWLEVNIFDFDVVEESGNGSAKQSTPEQISLSPQNDVIVPVDNSDDLPF